MLRPFRSYAALGRLEDEGRWQGWRGPIKWLLVIACVVSWTTAGRLLPDHLLFAPLSWAFAPAFQAFWIVVVARSFSAHRTTRKLVDLYFLGHGPWFLLLMLLAGVCLFAPAVWPFFRWLLETRLLLLLLLVAAIWSGLLTYAMFRGGLVFSRRASLAATASFYAGYAVCLVGFFAVTGQLLPLFGVFW